MTKCNVIAIANREGETAKTTITLNLGIGFPRRKDVESDRKDGPGEKNHITICRNFFTVYCCGKSENWIYFKQEMIR